MSTKKKQPVDFDAAFDFDSMEGPEDPDTFAAGAEEGSEEEDIFGELEAFTDGDDLVDATAPLIEIKVSDLRRALIALAARPTVQGDYTSALVRMTPGPASLEMWTTNGIDFTSAKIEARTRLMHESQQVHIKQLQALAGLQAKNICLTLDGNHLYAVFSFGRVIVSRYSIPDSCYNPGLGPVVGAPMEVTAEALLRVCKALARTVMAAEHTEYANLFLTQGYAMAVNDAVSNCIKGAFPDVVLRRSDLPAVAKIAKEAEGKVLFQEYEGAMVLHAPSMQVDYIFPIIELTVSQEQQDVLKDRSHGYTVEMGLLKKSLGLVNGLADFEEYVDLLFEEGSLTLRATSKRGGSTEIQLSDLFEADGPEQGNISVSLSVMTQTVAAHTGAATVMVYLSADHARLMVESDGVKTSARGVE